MKYIIGTIAGIILGVVGVASAGIIVQDNIKIVDYANVIERNYSNYPDGFRPTQGNILKFYDASNGAVCYEALDVGISCYKNN